MKKHNFYAGPSILPQPVFKQASEAVLNFEGTGLSILEISHRSKEFVSVLDETESLIRELVGLDDSYDVLFLTGGASSQFFMTCYNYLNPDDKAYFVNTGTWSKKAIKEANLFGNVEVLASSDDQNYSYIPKGYQVPSDGKYLHLTSNNTIFGTQYHTWPDTDLPIVCDMSSDIMSRPIDSSKFGIIYAGAQKNLGPAGVTIVIIKKEWAQQAMREIPTMLDYKTHITKQSSFNTPPVFPIFVTMLNLRWLKENGGVAAAEQRNQKKAGIIYNEIDRNPLFKGHVIAKEDRSLMNITFNPVDESHQAPFLQLCDENNIVGIKGHRSVGGFRASVYNALAYESAEALVETMQKLETMHG